MRLSKLPFAVMFLFIVNPLLAQNNKIAQSLLWRISGNGLKKPSYLYGTVHLRNKQLFDFGDSLYKSIEKTDGFAMELDPDEMSAAVADHVERDVPAVYLREKLNKKEFEKLKKKLKKEFDIDAEELTVKDFYNLKDKLVLPELSQDDMATFMDAWLYSIAKGQGKFIVGLEDIADQYKASEDEVYELDPRDVKNIFNQVKAGRQFVKQMLHWYQQQDIAMLQIASRMSANSSQDSVFTKRNQKMAYRFDSLIKRDLSYFVAVGAAHLAGEHGVISLMLKKGYTVEPVYSSRKIPAAQYVFKKADIKWQEFEEPSMGYSVMMPGKPSPSEMLNGEMKVRMYYDLGSGMVYYVSFIRPMAAVTEKNKDSVFNRMVTSTIESGSELISQEKILRYGVPGVEIFYRNKVENMFIRMQILAKGRKIYMVMQGSQKKQSLENDSDDFFNSFKILEDVPAKWTVIPYTADAFEMKWPQTPELATSWNQSVDSTFKINRYMSVQEDQGMYYFLLVSRTTPNFIIPDDSVYFDGVYEHLKLQNYQSVTMPDRFTWQGYPAAKITAATPAGLQFQARAIIRGNRVYSAMVMYESEKKGDQQIDQFFNSLNLIPYAQPGYQKVYSPLKDFHTELPIAALTDNSDSTDTEVKSYYGFDSVRATTYTISHKKLSPYLWAKSDTGFLRKEIELLNPDKDSLISFAFSTNGLSKGINYALKARNSSLVHFIRVILHGRNVYYLEARTTGDEDAAAPVQHFFNSFTPLTETGGDLLSRSNPSKLFNALISTDSLTYNTAYEALRNIEFTKEETSLLLKQALTFYPEDTIHYKSVNDMLFDKLHALKDTATLWLIRDSYPALSREQEKYKYTMLAVLATIRSRESYKIIESLITSGLPKDGRASGFLFNLHDSLLLTKTILPTLQQYIGDTILSMPLAFLQQTMLDSSVITITDIAVYRKPWIAVAGRRLPDIFNTERNYSDYDSDLINVLLSYNDKEANKLAVGFLSSPEIQLKQIAFLGLLKNGEPVSQYHAMEIASDKYRRINFYEELLKGGNEKFFPKKFFHQKSFAESYLYRSFDDDEPSKIIPIGDRVTTFRGEKQKFYLYKLVYRYDGEEFSHLGISGPFSVHGSEVLCEYSVAGVSEEAFQQSKIAEQLKQYLLGYEEEE